MEIAQTFSLSNLDKEYYIEKGNDFQQATDTNHGHEYVCLSDYFVIRIRSVSFLKVPSGWT
jgi:hypothetical protein